MAAKDVAALAGLALAIGALIWLLTGEKEPGISAAPESLQREAAASEKPAVKDWSEMQALTQCQHMILLASKYGDAERPPFTRNVYSGSDEFRFEWPRGAFHFRNGFNAKVPMAAACRGSLLAGRVEEIILNGESVYSSTIGGTQARP